MTAVFAVAKITPPTLSEPRWYAVHTRARAEYMVHKILEKEDIEHLYLRYYGTIRHARRVIAAIKPLMPRYLFVCAEDDMTLHDINHMPGVSTIVYDQNGPYQIASDVIEELKSRGNEDGFVDVEPLPKTPRRRYQTGEMVRVFEGPFRGYTIQVLLDTGKEVRAVLDEFKSVGEIAFPPEVLGNASP